MKKFTFTYILITFFSITSVIGQGDCDIKERTGVFNYSAIKSGGGLEVDFYITTDYSLRDEEGYYHRFYEWQFGNGESYITDDFTRNEPYEGHFGYIYDLSNSSVINADGNFEAEVDLYVHMQNGTGSNRCYHQEIIINYDLQTGSLNVDLFTEPRYNSYPVDEEIKFYANVNLQGNDPDNYYFTFYDGYNNKTTTQPLTTFNTDFLLKSITPSNTGSYDFYLTITRYGNELEPPKTTSITVTDNSDNSGDSEYLCTNLRPAIEVDYEINNDGYVVFNYTDVSSQEFQDYYQYSDSYFRYKAPDGQWYYVKYDWCSEYRNGELVDYICPGSYYSGFSGQTTPQFSQPNPLQEDAQYTFQLRVECETENGEFDIVVNKKVTVPAKEFNPVEENEVLVPEDGGDEYINTYTNACKSISISNKTYPNQPVDWISDVEVGYGIEFEAEPNYDDKVREFEIKIFAEGDYELNSEVNGEQKNYRLVTVKQPTYISHPNEEVSIQMPELNFPAGTKYYRINNSGYWNSKNEIDPYEELLPYLNDSEIEITYYDESGNVIGSEEKSFVIFEMCGHPTDYALIDQAYYDTYFTGDINFFHKNKLDITAKLNPGKHMALMARDEITLKEGFTSTYGSTFHAKIAPCVETTTVKNLAKDHNINSYSRISSEDDPRKTENTINIYPNPTQNTFTVEFSQPPDEVNSIEILNATGKQINYRVPETNQEQFDMRMEMSGLYLIKVTDITGNVTVKKLILNK